MKQKNNQTTKRDSLGEKKKSSFNPELQSSDNRHSQKILMVRFCHAGKQHQVID